MPAIRYGIRLSWRERRTCLGYLSQGLRLSSGFRQQRPLIRSSTHVPDHPIDRLQLLHWFDRSRRSRRCHSRKHAKTFIPFRELTLPTFHRVGTRRFSSSVQFCTTWICGLSPWVAASSLSTTTTKRSAAGVMSKFRTSARGIYPGLGTDEVAVADAKLG